MNKATTGAFIGALAVITWREINNPPASAPLPLPMPSRYVGAAIVFGILEFMSDIWNPKISDVLAIGLFLGLAINTAQTGIAKNAGKPSGPTLNPTPGNPGNNAPTAPGEVQPGNGGLYQAPGGQ